MKDSNPTASALESAYTERYEKALKSIARGLKKHVFDCCRAYPRIDRVTTRAKDVDSFIKKSFKEDKGVKKYSDPLNEIHDQIGCRIITFYPYDVDEIGKIILRYFRAIEFRQRIPESEWEFGYFGKHYVLILPEDVVFDEIDRNLVPPCFELQIKTLFQHAWSEAEHDLGYKIGEEKLTSSQKRRFAFTSAQAWGADKVFDELFREIHAISPSNET